MNIKKMGVEFTQTNLRIFLNLPDLRGGSIHLFFSLHPPDEQLLVSNSAPTDVVSRPDTCLEVRASRVGCADTPFPGKALTIS